MLAKLERTYLSILRVVVLIAATLALLATALGTIRAVPPLVSWFGLTESRPSGGNLADFIAEQKPLEDGSEVDALATEPFILPDLKEAAKIIHDYLGKKSTLSLKDWELGLQQGSGSIGPRYINDYTNSVLSLARELPTSKGKPLSQNRVAQLIDWHKNRFESEVLAREGREAEANAKFWTTTAFAGAAFLTFILIIFVFLFVKIERSLRVVHTQRIEDYNSEATSNA